MKGRAILVAIAILVVWAADACTSSPGAVRAKSEVQPPSQIVAFQVLYRENCAGCHGEDGKGGAASALANPVLLAIADDSEIRRTTANGVPDTSMPAFAQSAGGMLTDPQIDSLVEGVRSWANPEALGGMIPPPYRAQTLGDPQRGADVYRTYCSSCHGADGRGGNRANSIVDGSYLTLVSEQRLRTIVIAGLPDLGAPDWRGDVAGHPMSEQEISDVVAWLSSQRPQFPGQPYPISPDRAEGEHR
jgi:cytochrome c oxidase cbb3-type subunit III